MKNKIILALYILTSLAIMPVIADNVYILDVQETVKDGEYWSFTADFIAEVEYTIDFTVISGQRVDLIVLDGGNIGYFRNTNFEDRPVELFNYFESYSVLNTTGRIYTITHNGNATLYFVVENAPPLNGGAMAGDGDADISLKISYDDNPPTFAETSPGFEGVIPVLTLMVIPIIVKKKR